MDGDPSEIPLPLRLSVPEELGTGVYSNLLGVWHTPHEFTLDFAVIGQPDFDDDGKPVVMTAPVVARIKVPTNVIFNIARAIADNVSKFEGKFGPITPQPEPVIEFPPEGDDS